MGLLSWLFAKPCADDKHQWVTTQTSNHAYIHCRRCGTGK